MNNISIFKPFVSHSIGLDDLFSDLNTLGSYYQKQSFPKYDIVRVNDDGKDITQISIALAGYSKEDVTVTVQENILSIMTKDHVANQAPEENASKYLHKGIAKRSFNQRFVLGQYVEVKNVSMRDGLMNIELEKIIPKSKVKTFEIE